MLLCECKPGDVVRRGDDGKPGIVGPFYADDDISIMVATHRTDRSGNVVSVGSESWPRHTLVDRYPTERS